LRRIQIATIAISSASAAELFCAFFEGNPPQCSFDHFSNVIAHNEDITVVGQPATFTDTSVTSITVESTQIDYFPTKVFLIFPNLTIVQLFNSSLPNLVTNAFDNCGKLTNIEGHYLRFLALPSGFAQKCVNLQTVGFRSGDLNALDVNALTGLTNLEYLDLSNNKITCIPPTFFSHTTKLLYIMLNGNQISSFDGNLLAGLPKLSRFEIQSNLIPYLPALNLAGTKTSVGSLVLAFVSNPIMALDPSLISTLFQARDALALTAELLFSVGSDIPTEVTCFTSANNHIDSSNWRSVNSSLESCFINWTRDMAETPVPCAPKTTTTSATVTSSFAAPGSCASDKMCRYYLDHLDRYTCVLDSVEGALSSISGTHATALFADASVTRVYFKNSLLSRVPPVLFTKFPNLDFLSVANCSLGMITNTTITQCGELTYLDARFNEIFHVSSAAFKNCKKLKTIDFTGNPIKQLDTSIFVQDPSLKKVILNGGGGVN
jgi:Leucine-rich repeat (LRR) protein